MNIIWLIVVNLPTESVWLSVTQDCDFAIIINFLKNTSMWGLAGHNQDTRCYGWGLDPRVNPLGRSPQFFSECFLCCDSCEFRMLRGGESSLLLSSPPYDYEQFLCWWGQSYKRTRQALSAAESHFTDMVSEVALCCQAVGLWNLREASGWRLSETWWVRGEK